MNSFAIVAFFAALAAANAGIIAPGVGILEGPSSRTTIVGPEGSVISSVAPGGKVITEGLPAVVGYSAPAVVSTYGAPAVVSTYTAPAVLPGPVVAPYSAPLVSAYSSPVLPAYQAPIVPAHGSVNTVVSGPSGTIAASRSLTAADLAAPVW